MGKSVRMKVGDFLKEREGKYNPEDKNIQGYNRLNKIDFRGNIHLSNKSSKTKMIEVHSGDLVISGINVSKGALAVYHGDKPIVATIHYSSYEFDDKKINIEYFKRFLKSPLFLQLLRDQVKGGIKTEIKSKHFLPIEIELPNINDQKKVVSFFERIETEIEDLSKEITTQESYLKNFRQAVLQEAIEGKLTADWRKQNPDLINGKNHASKLFEKIRLEKEKLIAEGKIKKQKLLIPIKQEEALFILSEGWIWTRLVDVIIDLPRNGYSPKGVNYVTKIKNLKLGATTYGRFNPNEFKYIAEIIENNSNFWLKDGDILIQRGNSMDYVGVSAIYRGKANEFIYPDLMMKIKNVHLFDVTLMHMFLSSPFIRKYFRRNAKGSQETMPKINQGVVINVAIPLVPIAEQKEIVKRVDKLMTMIDALEKQVVDRKQQSKKLMQSVLKEAFS